MRVFWHVTPCFGAVTDVSTDRATCNLQTYQPWRSSSAAWPRDPAKHHKQLTHLTHSTTSPSQLHLNSTYAVRHVVISRRRNWVSKPQIAPTWYCALQMLIPLDRHWHRHSPTVSTTLRSPLHAQSNCQHNFTFPSARISQAPRPKVSPMTWLRLKQFYQNTA